MEDITLSATVVSLIVGTLLPVLVGIVTKARLSSGLKGLLLLTFAAVQGLIVGGVVMENTAVFSSESLILAAQAYVMAVASYYGVWKPNGVTSSHLAPEAGVG